MMKTYTEQDKLKDVELFFTYEGFSNDRNFRMVETKFSILRNKQSINNQKTFRKVLITMSFIIGNDNTNKQWAVVTVVLYNKKKMFKLVKYKFSKVALDTTLKKEIIDFMYIRLLILWKWNNLNEIMNIA